MRILLDTDEVLAGFIPALLDVVKEITGRSVWKTDITSWTMWPHLGCDSEELEAVQDALNQPGFCESLPLLPGAKEFVASVSQRHQITYVTSPWPTSPTWSYERTSWLQHHFGQGVRVIHTGHKDMVAGDVLIDDCAAHVREWGRANPDGLALLFDQPANRRGADDLQRVHNYQEALSAINKFEKEMLR